MEKKTKMLLIVGGLAAAGYYLWKKSKKTTTTAAFAQYAPEDGIYVNDGCRGDKGTFISKKNGNTYYRCCQEKFYSDTTNGHPCPSA